ncbi:hypothetical protein RI129_005079 [Pyrocoelia pectoralis]|uniref:Myb/SANT-like DNA-binding domain-containing protein 3 n=1 Tax=Pyrocoelia pectoralis TaxID=417401 RepID=A0AAN7VDH8_9COLE
MSEQKKYITPSEKIFVTELVSKHKNIVECKKTDVVNAAEKKKTWTLITTEFNSVPDHTKRTPQQLQKAWENIKCRRKKELSKEKRERMATGGGVIKAPPTDDAVDGILDCVDIEIKDVIDSDETMLSINYALVDNNLVPIEISEEINGDNNAGDLPNSSMNPRTSMIEDETPKKRETFRRDTTRSSALRKGQQRGSAIDTELAARVARLKKLEKEDVEFHMMRMENERQLHAVRLETEKIKLAAETIILEYNKKKFME